MPSHKIHKAVLIICNYTMSALLVGGPTRFDLILLVIGIALVAGAGVGWLSSLPLQVAIVGATVVAAVAMIDGLVWHPPGE